MPAYDNVVELTATYRGEVLITATLAPRQLYGDLPEFCQSVLIGAAERAFQGLKFYSFEGIARVMGSERAPASNLMTQLFRYVPATFVCQMCIQMRGVCRCDGIGMMTNGEWRYFGAQRSEGLPKTWLVDAVGLGKLSESEVPAGVRKKLALFLARLPAADA